MLYLRAIESFLFGYNLLEDSSTASSVDNMFPLSINQIIKNSAQMSITNVKFDMSLQLGWYTDGEGDRTAYGGDAGRGIEPSNKNRCY